MFRNFIYLLSFFDDVISNFFDGKIGFVKTYISTVIQALNSWDIERSLAFISFDRIFDLSALLP